MSSETKFLVKILSGLHTGAEYHLPPGETRLGSSPQCDLVLHDKGIAEELLAFTCAGEGVEIRSLAPEDALLLDGEEQDGPFTITDFGVLSTAALYLAVGAGDKRRNIPPPAQLFAPPEVRPAPVPESGDHAQFEEPDVPEDTDISEEAVEEQVEEEETENVAVPDEPQSEMEDEPQESDTEHETASQHPVRASRRAQVAAVLVALALVSLAAWHWFGDESDPAREQAPTGPRVSMKQIRDIADRYGLDATFELSRDNILTVEGYALNTEDEHGFVRAMFDRGIIVKPSLIITEQFRSNIQNILEQHTDPARNEQVTTSMAEGDIKTLVLRGYVQDSQKWNEILSETVGEVASIGYIDEVVHWDRSYGFLQELLVKHELGDRLYLEQDRQNDRVLLFSPYLDEAGQEQLGLLMEEYRQAYSYPEILFNEDMDDTVSAPGFIENALVGASFNARPYLLFDDGQRYFVGSVTADGYRVEEINEQFAVFSRDGQRYNYNFDDPQ